MKPRLVIGLGNPLMGDDGVGCTVADRLARDPRLPEDVDVISGETDLLCCATDVEGRERVLVIDAVQDDAPAEPVLLFEEPFAGLEERQDNAHNLSAVQAIRLLKLVTQARFTLLGAAISSAEMREGLSTAVGTRMPAILDRVLRELRPVGEASQPPL
ncbi:MAG TPA: hydrogenase maturation protease [Bryobacteraceae bacterium]|nr:hydrogenase maturation protease [Bryobacteraceae bacterium]